MDGRLAFYLLCLIGYDVCAYFFLRRFAHRIWSYFLVGLLLIPFSGVIAYNICRNFFDLVSLICYAVFFAGVVLLIVCAVVSWKHFKVLRIFFSVLSVALTLVALDAFVIEPHWLDIRHEKMFSSKISRPIKVAVIADLQTDDVGAFEEDALLKVKNEKPDLILFPGDYVQEWTPEKRPEQLRMLNEIFKRVDLRPRLGVFVVEGDMEQFPGWKRIFEGLPFKVFDKSGTAETDEVVITGLNLYDSRYLKYQLPSSDKLHIVMGHAPDFALLKPDADLLVAGHTHGGQIKFPGYGPLLTLSKVPLHWAGGCMVDTGDGTMLCVSRGVGMERDDAPRVRFLCRPEIVFIEVLPET